MRGVVWVALLFVVLALYLFKRVQVVPMQTARIIERLGAYSRTLSPGVHFLLPIIERKREDIDLKEWQVHFHEPIILADSLLSTVEAQMWASVVDPVAAAYQVSDHVEATRMAALTSLRHFLGLRILDDITSSFHEIDGLIRSHTNEVVTSWGIQINRFAMTRITGPQDIQVHDRPY